VPIQRLRQILNGVYSVQIDSSPATVELIQEQIANRAAASQVKGKDPPPTKPPRPVPNLPTSLDVRPVDLLRKIGDLTTPSDVNMASLSASWATRRYFWAIEEPAGPQPLFKLSSEARMMDFHQKTLLSDEFGIGFGGLVLEQLFQADQAIDVSVALRNPGQYQNVSQNGTAQPDYLMWSSLPHNPSFVVECNGCQTRRDAAMNQIRRGLEQVPTLVFGMGDRTVIKLVVATLMQESGTTVYVIDPPDSPHDERNDEIISRDFPSERTGKNTWTVNNSEEFASVAWSVRRVKLLTWAGQFASARELTRGRRATDRIRNLPNLELGHHTIAGLQYRGRRIPLFPELGRDNLGIFIGVQQEILESALHHTVAAEQEQTARQVCASLERVEVDPYTSIGRDGTCFVVEGL